MRFDRAVCSALVVTWQVIPILAGFFNRKGPGPSDGVHSLTIVLGRQECDRRNEFISGDEVWQGELGECFFAAISTFHPQIVSERLYEHPNATPSAKQCGARTEYSREANGLIPYVSNLVRVKTQNDSQVQFDGPTPVRSS